MPASIPPGTSVSNDRLPLHAVSALAFDVFGTVVDWHGGISAAVAPLAAAHGVSLDGSAFANDWRAGYPLAMDRVRRGELPWLHIDTLHRMILDSIVDSHGLAGLTETERVHLNRAWHRLPAWPDSVRGLTRLKARHTITPLSNGNFSLLTEMAKHAGLPWDCVISAELFQHYKPDPEVYLGCARLLDLAPAELMMVACHPGDLRAARSNGLRTAYVRRPFECGPQTRLPTVAEGEFDIVASSFEDLADQLGAA